MRVHEKRRQTQREQHKETWTRMQRGQKDRTRTRTKDGKENEETRLSHRGNTEGPKKEEMKL